MPPQSENCTKKQGKEFTLDFISIYTVTTDKKAEGGYLLDSYAEYLAYVDGKSIWCNTKR